MRGNGGVAIDIESLEGHLNYVSDFLHDPLIKIWNVLGKE